MRCRAAASTRCTIFTAAGARLRGKHKRRSNARLSHPELGADLPPPQPGQVVVAVGQWRTPQQAGRGGQGPAVPPPGIPGSSCLRGPAGLRPGMGLRPGNENGARRLSGDRARRRGRATGRPHRGGHDLVIGGQMADRVGTRARRR